MLGRVTHGVVVKAKAAAAMASWHYNGDRKDSLVPSGKESWFVIAYI